MQYKENRGYKGFETWFHSIQMEAKMYIYTFLIVLLLHLAIPVLYLFIFKFNLVEILFFTISNFRFDVLPRVFKVMIKYAWIIFVLATPIWLLYPAMLRKWKSKSSEMMKDQHLRGSKLVSEDELKKLMKNEQSSLQLGRIPLPTRAETRHFLVTGRPGTGKTTLMNSVISKLRDRGEKCLIYDFKGDYLSHFYRAETDYIFNPLDTRSMHWCLFDEIRMHPDIDSIATSLIPPANDDKFWTDAARDVFASILHYCVKSGETTNADIWKYASYAESPMLELMQNAVEQGIEEAKRATGYLQGYEKGSKVASDVLSTMRQYTNAFFYTRHLGNDFSIKRWLEEDGSSFIFLTNYSNLRDTLKPLLSLFLDTALKHLLSLPENLNRRRFVIIDEFASLQRLSSLVQALEQARSKGGSIWIATQDVGQIQKIYSPETTNTIVNTSNTLISFALNDPLSSDFLSRAFGEREILETDESISMGPADQRDGLNIQRRRKTEKLLLPSEFITLPDLNFYIKMLSYPITQTRVDITRLEKRQDSFVLNPIFHLKSENENG